jgi:hypothetical protein
MLAEQLLVLLYDPETGRPLVSSDEADLALEERSWSSWRNDEGSI